MEDMRYVEKITSKRSKSSTPHISDDDIPLGLQRTNTTSAPPPKKGPKIDWFEFFLSAGCDIDDCTRYATSFERDKIDESILPDITDSTMRSLGLREGDIIRVTKVIQSRKAQGQKSGGTSQEQLLRDEEMARQLQAEEHSGSGRKQSTTNPAPNLFAGPGGALKNAAPRRARPPPSKSLPPATVDLKAISTISDQIQRTSSPQVASPAITTPLSATPVQPPQRSSSALAPPQSGFDDDAWTNRPSSTRPIAPTPPITTRAPSVPPAQAAAAATPAPAQSAPVAPPAQPQNSGGSLANTTESDIFNQLSRLSELRKNSALSPTPPQLPAASPSITTSPPVGYQSGLGMGSSPAPMGQHFQNQQTGILPQPSPQPYNGPRGPFAPVPANQSLLQPLIPTQTGFNNFVPTRPGNMTSPFQGQQPPFLSAQPTGFPPPQPMNPQPTGMPFGGFGGNSYQNNGFGQVQTSTCSQNMDFKDANFNTDPTGFNPGFGQSPFNNPMSPPPSLPPPSAPSNNNNTSPANIFAQMKSGTFASENDALHPQPAGMLSF